MADTNFVPRVTRIVSTWLQDVNDAVYRANSAITGVTSTLYRSILAKLSDTVSVKDFGASGNGVTDDTAAFIAAIAAMAKGRKLYIPYGVYLISSTLTLNRAITIIGDGRENDNNARILKSASLNGPLFYITDTSVTIENLMLTGIAGNGGNGITIEGQRAIIRDVTITAMGNDAIRIGADGLNINANLWTLDSVMCYANGRRGLYLHSGDANANAGVATRCFFWVNTEDGVRIANADLNTFIGCTSEQNTGWGLDFISPAHDNMWVGGDIEANTAGQITKATGATRNNVFLPNHSWALGARAFNSGAQSIPDAAETKLTFDSERWDTDDCHSTSVSSGRLTANTAGMYVISASIAFADNATGRRKVSIRWNDATLIAQESQPASTAGDSTYMTVSTIYKMAAGDYVEVQVYQNSGGALNLGTFNQTSQEFSMIRQN